MFCTTFFGKHDRTKWETTEEGEILHIRTKMPLGCFAVQRRTCTKCGKLEMRTVRTRFTGE